MRDVTARTGVLGELFSILWKFKLYWLIPTIMTLITFAVLISISSNVAPFKYGLN